MNCVQKLTCGFVFLSSLIPVFAQADSAHTGDKKNPHTEGSNSVSQAERGQIVFEQNCSRCHNAPQAIPPQISATILRHMRVRASLSAKDEKSLLRFMNP